LFVAPFEANILITGRCNLACRHCGVLSQGSLASDLPVAGWTRILDRLVEAKLFTLTITGGEPLARKDFPEILREIQERPFRFGLNTNAILADDSVAVLLAGAKRRLNSVMVSLDGGSPEVHDALRGHGAFAAAMAGIKALQRKQIPICFYCTVTGLNARHLEETAELALSLGGWIRFNLFLDAGPYTDSALNPDSEDVRTAATTVLELDERYPGKIIGALLEMARLGRSLAAGEGRRFGPESGPPCGGGRSKIAVMPDGWVVPCDHLPKVRLGNLLRNSLEEILTGAATADFMETFAVRRRTMERCEDCHVSGYCPGTCPAAPTSELTCLRNYLPDQI